MLVGDIYGGRDYTGIGLSGEPNVLCCAWRWPGVKRIAACTDHLSKMLQPTQLLAALARSSISTRYNSGLVDAESSSSCKFLLSYSLPLS